MNFDKEKYKKQNREKRGKAISLTYVIIEYDFTEIYQCMDCMHPLPTALVY